MVFTFVLIWQKQKALMSSATATWTWTEGVRDGVRTLRSTTMRRQSLKGHGRRPIRNTPLFLTVDGCPAPTVKVSAATLLFSNGYLCQCHLSLSHVSLSPDSRSFPSPWFLSVLLLSNLNKNKQKKMLLICISTLWYSSRRGHTCDPRWSKLTKDNKYNIFFFNWMNVLYFVSVIFNVLYFEGISCYKTKFTLKWCTFYLYIK